MYAQIEVFLYACRIQNRNHRTDEFVVRLMRQRRGFCAVIIARNQQDATMFRSARMVRVLEHITATIYPRPLAVPHGEHAVVLGLRVQIQLLRAPYGCSSQLFIYTWHKRNVRFCEMLFCFPSVLVNRAEWRAAITGKEAARVEPRVFVNLPLQHHEAQKRVRAVHVHTARRQRKTVVERDVRDGLLHGLR